MGALEDSVKALEERISGISGAIQKLPVFLVKRGEDLNKNLVLVSEGLARLENTIEARLLQLEIRLINKSKSLELKLNALKGNSGANLETLNNKVNLIQDSVAALEKTAAIMEVKVAGHLERQETKADPLSTALSKIDVGSG